MSDALLTAESTTFVLGRRTGIGRETEEVCHCHNHFNWHTRYWFTLTQSISQRTKVGVHVESVLYLICIITVHIIMGH